MNVLLKNKNDDILYPYTRASYVLGLGNLLNEKQNVIDTTHKLSADLIDDTNTTNKFVTTSEKNTWNAKSDFSGSYNDLTDKPTIPSALSDLSDDSTHRVVTDAEKSTWNAKQDALAHYLKTASVSGNTLTITKEDDTAITFQGGSDIDNTTITKNGSDELQAVGITNGTTPLLYATIYDAITTQWEV